METWVSIIRPEVIGPVVGGLIGLCAVIGYYVIRYRRMELEAQRSSSASDADIQRELLTELKRMRADQDALRREVATLKQGTTGTDWEEQRRKEDGLRY